MTTIEAPRALTVPHTIDYEVLDCAECGHPFHSYACGQTVTLHFGGGSNAAGAPYGESDADDQPCRCEMTAADGIWFALTCADCAKRVEIEGIHAAETWAAGHECAA